MKNYLVLVRGSGPGFANLSEDERNTLYGSWMEYVKSLNESGNWVKGAPLDDSGRLYCGNQDPAEGIVGDADVSVDGYLLFEAESYEEAIDLCKPCPTFKVGGKVEIRECLEM